MNQPTGSTEAATHAPFVPEPVLLCPGRMPAHVVLENGTRLFGLVTASDDLQTLTFVDGSESVSVPADSVYSWDL